MVVKGKQRKKRFPGPGGKNIWQEVGPYNGVGG